MISVLVVGGGWAGCAAAMAASRAGAQVTLLERTDLLLGTGLLGGIMRNNGRLTAAEEAKALGASLPFELADKASRHRRTSFPGHHHASLYDPSVLEPMIRTALLGCGVKLRLQTRAFDVVKSGRRVNAVIAREHGLKADLQLECDALVDASGSAGPISECKRYGHGCVMCALRCVTFGGRVSMVDKAGIAEFPALRPGGVGSMSGSCKLSLRSLDPNLSRELRRKGVAVVPIPGELKATEILQLKACQQYATDYYARNLVLLHTGEAKLMVPFFPVGVLRRIPGFERAQYLDPYSGGQGNSIRHLAISPHDHTMRVTGLENVFVAGEKAGPIVGHTEAIITGWVAGFNAAKIGAGLDPTELPRTLVCGDFIWYTCEMLNTPGGLAKRYTFSGADYFDRMLRMGLYSTEKRRIRERVRREGVENIFLEPVRPKRLTVRMAEEASAKAQPLKRS